MTVNVRICLFRLSLPESSTATFLWTLHYTNARTERKWRTDNKNCSTIEPTNPNWHLKQTDRSRRPSLIDRTSCKMTAFAHRGNSLAALGWFQVLLMLSFSSCKALLGKAVWSGPKYAAKTSAQVSPGESERVSQPIVLGSTPSNSKASSPCGCASRLHGFHDASIFRRHCTAKAPSRDARCSPWTSLAYKCAARLGQSPHQMADNALCLSRSLHWPRAAWRLPAMVGVAIRTGRAPCQAACNFSSLISPDVSAPAALASLLFNPPEPQNHEKTQCFATFLPFRAPASSFFWSFLFWLFSLLTAFSSLHIVGSLTSKLPSMKSNPFAVLSTRRRRFRSKSAWLAGIAANQSQWT